ncbi:8-oxo-dGTP diphosphatase [Pseudarthrobacter sp. J1738]|uniref:8-oxo-dGTP diphosphatase n=1 Tax=unclassified Pseudarthrobacter TaxID=2647000 RepID=UPI003D2BD86F
MTPAPVTLCFLLDETSGDGHLVLLGLKKTGFGAGKIVGIGGHVEPGESVAQAAAREVFEECSVIVREEHLQPVGSILFTFPTKPEWDMDTTLFTARHWEGTPTETHEISPQWFDINELPFSQMWEDARHWLPAALDGEVKRLEVRLKEDHQSVDSVTNLGPSNPEPGVHTDI